MDELPVPGRGPCLVVDGAVVVGDGDADDDGGAVVVVGVGLGVGLGTVVVAGASVYSSCAGGCGATVTGSGVGGGTAAVVGGSVFASAAPLVGGTRLVPSSRSTIAAATPPRTSPTRTATAAISSGVR